MNDKNLTGAFNARSIPQLDSKTRKSIRGSQLVLIFDRGMDAAGVADIMLDVQRKTGLSYFTMVSRQGVEKEGYDYKKTYVGMPVVGTDSYMSALQSGQDPDALRREEFRAEVMKKWTGLHEPVAAPAIVPAVEAVVMPGVTDEDLAKALYKKFEESLKDAIHQGQELLRKEELRRAFQGPHDAPLVHGALCASAGQSALVGAFVFLSADLNMKYMNIQILEAAQTLKIPAGTDFNGLPLIAFPDDGDTVTVEQRSARAQRDLKLL